MITIKRYYDLILNVPIYYTVYGLYLICGICRVFAKRHVGFLRTITFVSVPSDINIIIIWNAATRRLRVSAVVIIHRVRPPSSFIDIIFHIYPPNDPDIIIFYLDNTVMYSLNIIIIIIYNVFFFRGILQSSILSIQ